MPSLSSLALAALLPLASASGFTTYKQLVEGADNSDQVLYYAPVRSTTLFVNVQIKPDGSDHTNLWNDFKTLATNYGSHQISIVPRVRYGTSDGQATPEPSSAATIAADVNAWAAVLNATKSTVTIPLVQAGFLGIYGEWHDGPFSQVAGKGSSAASLSVKKNIVTQITATGLKIALRTPQDHNVLANGQRSSSITIHNDCIFAQGPGGSDTGTFVDLDGQNAAYWISYTKTVAGDNGYGGEGCEDSSSGGYDWTNYGQLCGSNGLVKYINDFKIAYMNSAYPTGLNKLFTNPSLNATCLTAIQDALNSHKM